MNISSVIEISLATAALSIALFGVVSLLGNRDSRGLALFLAIAAFDSFDALVGYWGLYKSVPWIVGLEALVICLYGPAIYLYILTMTGVSPPRRRTALMMLGPFLGMLALYLAAKTLPAEVQLSMSEGQPIADKALTYRAGALMVMMSSLFLIITFGFLVASWRALDNNIRMLGALFSTIEDRTLSWLRFVLIVIFVAWSWAVVQPLFDGSGLTGEWSDSIDAAITLLWVFTLVYFGIRQRPTLAENAVPPSYARTAAGATPPLTAPAEKYARSALDNERMQKLADRMVRLVEKSALYRDPNLSLRQLADSVGASPNHISQTLNLLLGVNFYDFVNGFRVAEAGRLLRETDRTATDIALEVGFNSRSTFNAAMRKHSGTSPTEARRKA